MRLPFSILNPFGRSKARKRKSEPVKDWYYHPRLEELEDRTLLSATRILPGFDDNTLPAGDDVSSGAVPIGFEVEYFGQTHNSLFINSNGNLTFDAPFGGANPTDLDTVPHEMIAPFWADVNTTLGGTITFGNDVIDGHTAFGVTWAGVRFDGAPNAAPSTFQVIFIEQGNGDFTIEMNYDQIQSELNFEGGPEILANTTTAKVQLSPAIAADAQGNYVVVWASEDQDGDELGVFGQRFDVNGSPLGIEFQVNTTTLKDQRDPALAMDDAGNFVVTWTSRDQAGGESFDVFAQRFDSNGDAQGGEFRVNTTVQNAQQDPQVAMDDAGNFVIVWESLAEDGDGYGIFAQRFTSAGSALGGQFQVNLTSANEQIDPAVAMNADGAFAVVWSSQGQDGDGYGIFAQRYDSAGTAAGGEFSINTTTFKNQHDPALAMDDAGNFVVTWTSQDQDGDAEGIFAQRHDSAGSAQGGEFRVNTITIKGQLDSAVAMNATGNFVITWTSQDQDGDAEGIFAQRYDSAGSAQGGEFRVNTTTFKGQMGPAVAMNDTGNFVVAWQSEEQDGDGFGIFSRVFEREFTDVAPDVAFAGFTNGTGLPGTHYELIGSGIAGAFLDDNALTGLAVNNLRSTVDGRYVFEVRAGTMLDKLGLAGQAVEIAEGVVFFGQGIHPADLKGEGVPFGTDSNESINADAIKIAPFGPTMMGLTGTGVTVGVWEAFEAGTTNSEVLDTHQEFGTRVTIEDTNGPSRHATVVAGIIGASGGFADHLDAEGVATGVEIVSYDLADNFLVGGTEMNDAAQGIAPAQFVNDPLRISNHSWGLSNMGWNAGGHDFACGVLCAAGAEDTWIVDYLTGTITGATLFAPIVITSAGHNLFTGDQVSISGIDGTGAILALNDQDFIITVIGPNSFSLDGTDGTGGTYNTGGRWTRLPLEEPFFGLYNIGSSQLDDILFNNPQHLSIWAAGNQRSDQFSNLRADNTFAAYFSNVPVPGTLVATSGWYRVSTTTDFIVPGSDGNDGTGFDSVGPLASAKNNLVVGAIADLAGGPGSGTVQISNFSSFGPTDDGRLGVDVVANGVDVIVPFFATDIDLAQDINPGGWNLGMNAAIAGSTAFEHVSVTGTGNGTFDVYSFTAQGGDIIILDIDAPSAGFDSFLAIAGPDGIIFESDNNNDDMNDPTTSGMDDAFMAFQLAAGSPLGEYFVIVAEGPGGGPVPDGATYTLHVSVSSQAVSTGADPIAEVEPNNRAFTAADLTANDVYNNSPGYRDIGGRIVESGTSFAAPSVTGTAAMLLQHWRNLDPQGDGADPLSSTMKALLMHTAFDVNGSIDVVDGEGNVVDANMDGFTDQVQTFLGPDYATGYGVVDALAAAEFLTEVTTPVPGQIRHLAEQTFGGTAQQVLRIAVPAGGQVKATLVWTDPAGTSNFANFPQGPPTDPLGGPNVDDPTHLPALVNDLDLTIIGPNGTHFPWTLDPTDPTAPADQTVRNDIDNVEQVFIDAPIAGTYRIIVNGPAAINQNYSLLVSTDGVVIPDGEFQVNSFTSFGQFRASTAMDDAGNFVITWNSSDGQDGSFVGIFAQRFNSTGTPQGSEFLVNTVTSGPQFNPSVAMDADGDFVITWSSFDGDSSGIFAQRFSSTGVKQGVEFQVNSFTPKTQKNPSVAMDDTGNFVIAWESRDQDDPGGYGIFAQRFSSTGVQQGVEFQVNTTIFLDQGDAAIAMDSDGDFVISWRGADSGVGRSPNIYAQRYNSMGIAQGVEFLVNTSTEFSDSLPSIGMNAGGEFVIAWSGGGNILARQYDSNGVDRGPDFLVNTFTTGGQTFLSSAMDSFGNFVITWTSLGFGPSGQDGSDSGVFAQKFNSNGTLKGSEFQVNIFTTSFQSGPSITMDPDGDFVVAWTSRNQDGDQSGVFARLFDFISAPLLADEGKIFNGNTNEILTTEALTPIVEYAISLWEKSGLEPALLELLYHVDVTIADLPGGQLGSTSAGTIIIDFNAAGYGWFVDPTPLANEEFTEEGLVAGPDSPAYGRMDLLTAVLHELGHVLGFPDLSPTIDPTDVMTIPLNSGVRRLSFSIEVAASATETFDSAALFAIETSETTDTQTSGVELTDSSITHGKTSRSARELVFSIDAASRGTTVSESRSHSRATPSGGRILIDEENGDNVEKSEPNSKEGQDEGEIPVEFWDGEIDDSIQLEFIESLARAEAFVPNLPAEVTKEAIIDEVFSDPQDNWLTTNREFAILGLALGLLSNTQPRRGSNARERNE